MNFNCKLKIKLSYEILGTKFKAEKSETFENLDIIRNIISSYYETLLYFEEKTGVYNYELQFKVNDNDWDYYNRYDYCHFLKDKYFKDNENITDNLLLNKLDDMKFSNFMFYIRGLLDNEK